MFTELVQRHQDDVYGLALRFTVIPGDAEDIAQEAFLKAFRGLSAFKGTAKFSTWLYRIAYNLCIDWRRKNNRTARRDISLEEAGETADGRASVERDLLAEEDRARVKRAVDALKEPYRNVITLCYYQKLSYEEISAVLDVPLKTVETRLYRARGILRETLGRG